MFDCISGTRVKDISFCPDRPEMINVAVGGDVTVLTIGISQVNSGPLAILAVRASQIRASVSLHNQKSADLITSIVPKYLISPSSAAGVVNCQTFWIGF